MSSGPITITGPPRRYEYSRLDIYDQIVSILESLPAVDTVKLVIDYPKLTAFALTRVGYESKSVETTRAMVKAVLSKNTSEKYSLVGWVTLVARYFIEHERYDLLGVLIAQTRLLDPDCDVYDSSDKSDIIARYNTVMGNNHWYKYQDELDHELGLIDALKVSPTTKDVVKGFLFPI